MLFEDKIVCWNDSFDVFDELGRKLFHVEGSLDGGTPRLRIYDPYRHNRNVATVRESPAEPGAVEIKHGTRFVALVRKVRRKLRTIFDLGFLNWCAAGDFLGGVFSVFDANGRTVASVGEIFVSHEPMRVIDTLPEYTLHSLTFTLAVDVQISDAGSTADPAPAAVNS